MPKKPLPPSDFDDSAPELGETFFREARPAAEALGPAFMAKVRRPPGRPKAAETKEQVSLRLDADVLRHLRAKGPRWQTRVNDALANLIRAGEL